jgi:S-DNA-T family DNA segregation ATPase FtsK/SpoIIIE
MATRAAGRPLRSGTKPAKSKQKKGTDPRQSALSVAQSRMPNLSGLVPPASVFNRDLVGAISALIGLVTAWSVLAGESNGILVAGLDRFLAWLCGRAPYVIPTLTMLLSYQCFRNRQGQVVKVRQVAGGIAFGLAVTGLTHAAATGTRSERGGLIGGLVFDYTQMLVGDYGAGIALFLIGAAAVLVTTSTNPMILYRELERIGRAVYKPLPPIEDTDLFDTIPAVAEEPVKAIAATPDPEPAPAPSLVINTPKKESIVKKGREAVTRVVTGPKPSAEILALPDISQWHLYDQVTLDKGDLTAKAKRIEETLGSFKVEARVREINPGPAVTQFTLEPGLGTKVRRITELQNDLALALAAPSIRIEAPVPGLARVGLEIPNAKVATVGLRETLESERFTNGKFKLPVPLGRDVNGKYVIHDLTKMPHLLIAGATGSGKSVCLTAIISTFLSFKRPNELKMLMMDPKMVELVGYNGVPHLQCPVVTEMDKVVGALRLVLQEMERRYTLFSKMGVRNLDGYRLKIADEPGAEEIPYLVVIIDELADLMMTAPDDVETVLCRLAQMGRAAGIHLIIATQRPSVDVLTGLIKANVPARVAFAVTSLTDSRVVLDMPGAERLLGRGDMLFLPPDAAKPVRIQGAFIEDGDVQGIVDHWHTVSPVPAYAPEWLDLPSSSTPPGEPDDSSDDPLLDQAITIVKSQGTASASMLQRRLRIGYNRAARLIEQMEADGLIGPADGIKGRPVLDV